MYDNDLNLIQQANTIASGELISEIITTDQLNKNETYFIQIQNFNTNPSQTTFGSYEILLERCEDCCYNHKLLGVSELNTSTGDYNLGAQAIEWKAEIDRDLTVLNGRSLYINKNGTRDFLDNPNGIATSNSYLDAYVCNESSIDVNGGAKLEVGSEFNNDASLTVTNGSSIVLQSGSVLRVVSGSKLIVQQGAILDANNASIIVENNAELIIQANALFKMSQGTLRIQNGGKLTINYEGVMEYSGGDIFLNGATAEFELGGVVKVSGGSDFYLRNENPNINCGFLHITDAPYPESHFESIGTGKKLILEGSDMSNLILLLDDGAEFRFGSTEKFAEIRMQNGKIESGDDSRIVLSAQNNVMSRLTHHGQAGSRGIYVYRKNAFWNCDFNGSGKDITAINYYFNNQLRVYDCNFNGSASISIKGGSFLFNNTTFDRGVFDIDGITSPSIFNRCNVTDGMYINSLLNASTIKFKLCNLNGNTDFNSNNYIVNQGGKLEFSCNDILNYTIDATETLIDLSSFTNNGYNHFTNDHIGNRQYIILDNSTSSILWNNGYNTFESLLPDPQFRYVVPCGYSGTVNVKAYNNYWKNLPPNYEAYIDEGPVQNRFEFWCLGLGGYFGSGIFNTGDPIDNGDTPCGYRSVRSAPAGIIGRKDVAEITEDNPFYDNTTRNEFVDPVLNTSLLDSILLSEAIFLATNTMVFNDTLGNDFTAIDIFYDILTYDYDTLATDVDWMLDIAFANMKTTVENTFITDSITYADNASSFHPAVQKYVDVLMIRSDDEISEDNYIDQFYLEIDKAQLFNVIGKKKMSWQLLNNLDNCPVDSIEQAYLNQWIYAIGQEMLSIQAGVDNYGVDSLVGQIDTTLFNSPSPIEADEFYFGAQILGVNMVTYANCNLISFRNIENNTIQSNDFSVYPNPTSGILTIAYQQEEDANLNISIYNLMGKLVLYQSIIGDHGLMQIDIGHLPQASYQYTISDEGRVLNTGTIIKE